MAGLKKYLQRLSFLIMHFLAEFSYYLLLFSFPLLIMSRFQSVWLLTLCLLLVPFAKILALILAARLFRRSSPRFYYILGFSFVFADIILINRAFSIMSLPLVVLLWSLGLSFVKLAGNLLLKNSGKLFLGNWDFLTRPVLTAAMLIAPFFGAHLAVNRNYSDLFNYFGILMSLTALLYLLVIDRVARKSDVAVPVYKIRRPDLSILLTGFLYGYFWAYAPFTMYLQYGQPAALAWVLLWLSFPYLLLLIWKNIFRLRVWRMRTEVKYLAFMLPLLFLLNDPAGITFFLGIALLGLALGLLQVSEAQEKKHQDEHATHQTGFAIGFALALLWGSAAFFLGGFSSGLAAFGLLLALVFIVRQLLKLKRLIQLKYGRVRQ